MIGSWPNDAEVGVDELARHSGELFASFLLQDSGCRAYGVLVDGARWFVKGAVEPRAVPSLERAIAFHSTVRHPAIIGLRHVVRTPHGPVPVYPWVDGEVLNPAVGDGAASRRLDGLGRRAPRSAHERFRALPLADVLAAFDAVLDAHVAVTDAGFVAVDLYDGCFVYDFAAHRMWLCDLDEYRPGPFVLDADRLPGSTRFMAPEEFVRGAVIDERTTVFDLGRTAAVLLDRGPDAPPVIGASFRGTPAMANVLRRATSEQRADRHASVRVLADDWRRVVGSADEVAG